jgi:hypothetical protein
MQLVVYASGIGAMPVLKIFHLESGHQWKDKQDRNRAVKRGKCE